MSDMGDLFPDLEAVLANWDAGIPDGTDSTLPPEHSGITDSDVEQAAARMLANGQRPGPAPVVPGQNGNTNQFQSGQSAPPPPETHIEGGPNGQVPSQATAPDTAPTASASDGTPVGLVPEQAAETQEPPSPDDVIVDLGVDENNQPIRISRQRLLAYRGFEQELQDDPRLQQFLAHYLTTGELPSGVVGGGSEGTVQPPISPEPSSRAPESAIPEGIADDPTLSAMWAAQQQQIAELSAHVQSLSGGLQTSVQQQQLRQQAENESIIKRATSSFQTQHGLTDEDMTTLRRTAANLNVLQSLMSGIDPITGAPAKPDPLAAVERSLEIAMFSIPEYRNKEFQKTVRRRVEDGRRKQKLGALSGSSGSVPRTSPAPTTPEGRREAMVRELAQISAGEWSDNE